MAVSECEQCDRVFSYRSGSTGRFCSRDCYSASLRRHQVPAERPCAQCGRLFTPTEPTNPGRFCSRSCHYEARRKRPKPQPRPCEQCGTVFTPGGSADAGRFCSHDCYSAAISKHERPGWRTCAREGCGTRFRPTPSHAADTGARYCSHSCWMQEAWRAGEAPARGAIRTKAHPQTRQQFFGRWDGHKGAAAGMEGADAGQAGGRPVSYTREQAEGIWRLHREGWTSRSIAEAVFGDARYYKRVLRCLKGGLRPNWRPLGRNPPSLGRNPPPGT